MLNSHWVMVVLDQYTRRIIGFSVHAGDCYRVAYCRMFNKINSGKSLPKHSSTDNDPLFLFHRWQANLRIREIAEIKSVPGNPVSHPFIEQVIKATRVEYLDQFQEYYNRTRVHPSLAMKKPQEMTTDVSEGKKVISLDHYRWQEPAPRVKRVHWVTHCRGLYKLPIAE